MPVREGCALGRRGLRLIQWLLPVLVAVMAAAQPAQAAAWSSPGGHLQLGGDLRLRLEQDWDSVDAQGLPREDRTRARVRARAGLFFMPNEHLWLGLRLRTGADGSQQSAHITWAQSGGGDRGDADINLDQWYVRGQGKRWSGTAGRMVFPFFHQNEMFLG